MIFKRCRKPKLPVIPVNKEDAVIVISDSDEEAPVYESVLKGDEAADARNVNIIAANVFELNEQYASWCLDGIAVSKIIALPMYVDGIQQWAENSKSKAKYKLWLDNLLRVVHSMGEWSEEDQHDINKENDLMKVCSAEDFDAFSEDFNFLMKYGPRSNVLKHNHEGP